MLFGLDENMIGVSERWSNTQWPTKELDKLKLKALIAAKLSFKENASKVAFGSFETFIRARYSQID